MTIKITAPLALVQIGGALRELAIEAVVLGANSSIADGQAVYEVQDSHSDLIAPYLAGILAAGGDILNLPVYYAVADKTQPVPEGVPARSYTDENGDTIIKTWNEYDTDGGITVDGQEYVNSSCIGRVPALSEIGIAYVLEVPVSDGGI